jgi:hypothetical protein
VSSWSVRDFVIPIVLVALLTAQNPSGPEAIFQSAIEDFEFGEHAQAAGKLRSVLEPIKLKAREDLIVARQYLGACYHLLDDRPNAKKEFALLLALDPNHKLDPEVFSPALVQFFEEVRAEAGLKHQQVSPVPPPPPPVIAPPPPVVTPPPPPPPQVTTPAPADHSPAWSVVPFGVGQFANHHPVRGALFATLEVGLFATAIGTYLSFEGLKKTDGTFAMEDTGTAEGLQTAYLITFWGGIAIMAVGVLEALISYPGDVPPPTSADPTMQAVSTQERWLP